MMNFLKSDIKNGENYYNSRFQLVTEVIFESAKLKKLKKFVETRIVSLTVGVNL
jgi:hypothetical protein